SPSMFLDELSEMRTDEPEGIASSAAPAREGPAPIHAKRGLVFRWGGYECSVQAVDQHLATVEIGTSTVTIPFGSEVSIEGHPRRLVAPRTPVARLGGDAGGLTASPEIFDALKDWRLTRSRKDSVPAFVVASDRTLLALAAAMPTNEGELLDVHGIGATKVELYGEEILAVLDAVRPAS